MNRIGNIEVSGIILSGGAASRMKKEKGLCFLNGKPMITYVMQVLEEITSEIIISANNNDYQKFGHPVIPDEVRGIGPLAGIYSALKFSKTPNNIIISCDMPFITVELIKHILNNSKGYQVVIPVIRGLHEPLCAFYARSILPQLELMIEQKIYKLQEVSRFAKTRFLEISPDFGFYTPQLFSNINSPEELVKAETQIKTGNGK